MYTKYKIIPFCPYNFVHTILSNTILSVYHFVHTILSVPFCPLPFCPVTLHVLDALAVLPSLRPSYHPSNCPSVPVSATTSVTQHPLHQQRRIRGGGANGRTPGELYSTNLLTVPVNYHYFNPFLHYSENLDPPMVWPSIERGSICSTCLRISEPFLD